MRTHDNRCGPRRHSLQGPSAVIAHQGGWDEILLVVGPILVIAALIAVAQRKARRLGNTAEGELGAGPEPPAEITER